LITCSDKFINLIASPLYFLGHRFGIIRGSMKAYFPKNTSKQFAERNLLQAWLRDNLSIIAGAGIVLSNHHLGLVFDLKIQQRTHM